MLTGCQNPGGCRRIAVKTVKAVRPWDGTVAEETETCAYCADDITVSPGYDKVVE